MTNNIYIKKGDPYGSKESPIYAKGFNLNCNV